DAQLRRVKGIAVEQQDIHSAQAFALVLVRARREVFRHEAHTLDIAGVQICSKLLRFDPGSADHLKRRIGPPPDGYVRALDQTYAGIERGRGKTAQIRRWINPQQARGIEPVAADPSFHGDNRQLGFDVALRIEHLRQLADRHPVPHRYRMIVHETLRAGIGNRSLHEAASHGIGTVKDNNGNSRLCRGLQEITQCGFVGVEPRAGILNVVHDGVQRLQHLEWRTALGVSVAIDAVYRYAGGTVHGIADLGGVQLTQYAMFRGKNRGQLQRGSRRQDV